MHPLVKKRWTLLIFNGGKIVKESAPVTKVVSSEIPHEETKMELLAGNDLAVSFTGSTIKLKFEYDFERRGHLDIILTLPRPKRKFDFFRLPIDVRNRIYSFVFPEDISERSVHFRKTKPVETCEMMDRMNKKAVDNFKFHALNDDLRHETTAFVLRGIRFHACGDKLAYAFLSSLGSHGRVNFQGAFGVDLTLWVGNDDLKLRWMTLLAECKSLREITLIRHRDQSVDYTTEFRQTTWAPFSNLLMFLQAKLPRLERLKIPYVDTSVEANVLSFVRGG
ncbi:hypothetical protein HDK64DRAFT_312224 [Phyllosticta capitalensis]